jgi:hypothetical protein
MMGETEGIKGKLVVPPPTAPSNDRAPVWWMAPVWLVGRVRSGLREAALADRSWLNRVPIMGVALPALAIVIPLLITLLHATTPQSEQAAHALAVVIEMSSPMMPFMAVALVLGIVGPRPGRCWSSCLARAIFW